MPQYILVQLSQGKNLTKWSHLYSLADELGVTISNLIHRLQDLGWIYLAPNSSQINLVISNNNIRSSR